MEKEELLNLSKVGLFSIGDKFISVRVITAPFTPSTSKDAPSDAKFWMKEVSEMSALAPELTNKLPADIFPPFNSKEDSVAENLA